MNERISEIHRKHHRQCLRLARTLARHDRPAAFRMLALAKSARFYFAALRAIGE